MLPVLCHCPTCEELDPADCLFIHPSRVELGPSQTCGIPCPKAHDAVTLCGAYKFDWINSTVELDEGIGLKSTRHVFKRLSQKMLERRAGQPTPSDSPPPMRRTSHPKTKTSTKIAAALCAAFALAGSVVARAELQEDIERAISAAEDKLHKRHHLDPQGQQQDAEFRDTSEELRAAGASQYEAARLLHKLQIAYRMRGSDETDDGIPGTLPVELWDQQEKALSAFNETTARAIQLLNEFVIKYPGAWSPTAVYIPHYFTRGAG